MLTSSQQLCRTEAKDNEISAFALDNIEVNYWTENPQQDKDNVGLKNMSNIMTGSNISTRGRVNSAPQDIMLGNDKRKGKRVRNKSDDAAETSTPKSAKTSLTPRGHLPAACKNPASVAKRNARERRRIKNVNLAFDELREHVPSGEQNKKKISKVDTLQSAIIYIKTLERLVMQKRKQEEKKTNNQEVDTDLEKASSSTEASILDEPAMPGSTIGDDICSENTSIVNSDLSPMLDEFDGAISTSTSSSHPSMVEDVNDDIVSNIEFDDSGYSEGSPGSHCERDPTIHHPSLSNDITYQETCVATDKSGLREVSAYDVETFLDNPMTAVETSSTVQQFSPPYTTGHGNFAYPQSCTIPTQSWFNCPESSPTPYQQQFSPLPLASTPRNENVQTAFVFPPPNTVPFVTQQQAFSESSDVSTIRPTVYEPHTVYEGYRFGGTFA